MAFGYAHITELCGTKKMTPTVILKYIMPKVFSRRRDWVGTIEQFCGHIKGYYCHSMLGGCVVLWDSDRGFVFNGLIETSPPPSPVIAVRNYLPFRILPISIIPQMPKLIAYDIRVGKCFIEPVDESYGIQHCFDAIRSNFKIEDGKIKWYEKLDRSNEVKEVDIELSDSNFVLSKERIGALVAGLLLLKILKR